MQQDGIINAIIADAVDFANKTVNDAQIKADKIIQEANTLNDFFLQQKDNETELECKSIIDNKKTLCALETKKLQLQAKRKVLDCVYQNAILKLQNLDDNKYLALIDALILKNASAGDTVIISKSVRFAIDKVKSLPSVKSLNLTVKGGGDFGGGLILQGKNFDKNLTFSQLVEDLKRDTETEISNKLFGEI